MIVFDHAFNSAQKSEFSVQEFTLQQMTETLA